MSTQRNAAGDVDAVVLAFMIADIRDYSRFSRAHGDKAAAALARRFAVLARDCVEARNGSVIELRGDEVFATFPTAGQAVQAAVEFQLSCIEESERDPSLPLLVGVGIDVGQGVPVEGGYRGIAINLAARLCSSAGAGQVLLTKTAAEQSDGVGGDVELTPRGTSTFKGFDEPVSVVEAHARTNPVPLGESANPGRTLPPELVDATPLIGRGHEMCWLRGTWRQVRRGRGRIVAIDGPAGIGKTRLAAEAASHVRALGGAARYAGPGGLAAATALKAVSEARSARTPSLVVIDQLDVVSPDVIEAIDNAATDIARSPVLLLLLLREVAASPAMAALIERCAISSGHRCLSPLSPAEVADVVALYAGDSAAEAPVEMIVRASRGIPALVHERASEWARAETARRLEAAAGFMAAARERRTADLEFANNVIGLKLGRLYAPDTTAVPPDIEELGPYKGLAAFDSDDAAWFFGREQLVGELAARTVASGALAILGASGSGKSSVVSAGLLPSLRAGLLPGSGRWTQAKMRPSGQPMAALRAALSSQDHDPIAAAIDRLGHDGRLVLVIDQFEEVFAVCDSEVERRAFLDLLAGHAARDVDHFAVIVTLRSDFYGDLAGYPALAGLLADNHVLVGPLSRGELQRVVQLPAQRAGIRIESALVDALVDEAAGEPGALPLLSTALVELWQARSGGWIRADAYRSGGGIRGAVARLAEASYAQLDEADQNAARRVLLRLASTSEGGADVRRRVELEEFDLGRDVSGRRVIDRFTADRLLTVSGPSIEVAHEALLREWPRLRTWLEEDMQGRQLRQHLTLAANGWHAADRDPSELYRGARLNAVLEWADHHAADLNDLERSFLNASRAASDAEAAKTRRTNRRLRRIALALATVVVLAVAGGVVALVERSSARTQAQRARAAALTADAGRLAALSANAPDTAAASQLALAAYRLDDTQDTRTALLAAVERTGGALWRLGFPARVFAVFPSPDGHRLLVPLNGAVWIVDSATHVKVGHFAMPSDATLIGSTADGHHAVLQENRQVSLVTVPSGAQTEVLPANVRGLGATVTYGGRWLAVDTSSGASSHTIDVFDLLNPAAPPRVVRTAPDPKSLAAGTTALAVEYADGSADVWALPSGRDIGHVAPAARSGDFYKIAVSPNGALLARLAPNETTKATLYDTRHPGRSGIQLPPLPGVGDVFWSFAFSPDGSKFAFGSSGGPVSVYSTADGSVIDSFVGNGGQTFDVAWSGGAVPALYSVGLDGNLVSWDVRTTPRLLHEHGHDYSYVHLAQQTHVGMDGVRPVLAFEATPDNQSRLAIAIGTGKVSRWPIDAHKHDGGGNPSMSVTSDGRYALEAVTQDRDWTRTSLWDLRTKKIIWEIRVPPPPGVSAESGLSSVISPDGSRAYIEFTKTRIGVYALPSGTYLRSITVHFRNADPRIVAWPWSVDPAGHLVVVGFDQNGPDNRLGLVDVASGRLIAQVALGDIQVMGSQAWSKDGRLLAVGTYNGAMFLLDANTLAIRARVNGAEPGEVRSISFSPDGKTIVTGGPTGELDYWKVPSLAHDVHITIGVGRVWAWYDTQGQLVGIAPDPNHPDPSQPDRTTPGEDLYRWFRFDTDISSIATEACALAGGNLTRGQWQRYVGDQPYQPICPATH